jgi:hypothetical protein
MKVDAKHEPLEDKRLSELLTEWKVESSLPPRFQEQVWQRISDAKARKPEAPWTVLMQWIEAVFARPAFAASYVAVLLLAGLGAGLWQAHTHVAQSESNWRERYVQMVDPYRMPRQ